MKSSASNIYEANQALGGETERLADFELPMQVSIKAIGELAPGASFLDVGAGPNLELGEYVRRRKASYTAFDRNDEFLARQREAGSLAVQGDARHLPFQADSFDITHTRFVLAHLGEASASAIAQIMVTTKPSGRAIFIDYDWTSASGSEAFNEFRDLMIDEMLFDAAFGAKLEQSVRSASNDTSEITASRYRPPKMYDYSQILRLQSAANTDLSQQNKDPEIIKACNALFTQLEAESQLPKPPGFHFPDFVIVTAKKS